MSRFEELVSGYLEGTLSREETESLARMVHDDPELEKKYLELTQVEGMLCSKYVSEPDRDSLAERIENCLRSDISRKIAGRDILERIKHGRRKEKRFIIPRIMWVSLAACLFIAAGAYVFNLYQMSRTPELIGAGLIEVHGKVLIERNDSQIPAEKGMQIYAGDRMRTGKGGSAEVKYNGEATVITVQEESDLEFHKESGAKRINVTTGGMTCTAAPQPVDKRMQIKTPHAEALVLGTEFTVQIREIKNEGFTSRFTLVSVDEGKVAFTRLSDRKPIAIEPETFAVAGDGLALKIYKKGTQYIDGPVIYKDDFESGLAQWKPVAELLSGHKKTQDMFKQFVSIEDDRKSGAQNRSVKISSDKGYKFGIKQTIQFKHELPCMVQEYDAKMENTVVISRIKVPASIKNKWVHIRLEYYKAGRDKDYIYFKKVWRVNSKQMDTYKAKTDLKNAMMYNISFTSSDGACQWFDNLCLRYLIPLADNP